MDVIERWWITTGADGRGFLAYDSADEAMAALGKHDESERVVEVVPSANHSRAVDLVVEVFERPMETWTTGERAAWYAKAARLLIDAAGPVT